MYAFYRRNPILPVSRITNMVVPAQAAMFLVLCLTPSASADTSDQPNRFVFERDDRTIVLEPFGPNIVRVTLSSDKGAALGAPGYGIIATPSMTGWTHEQDSAGYDTIRSDMGCPTSRRLCETWGTRPAPVTLDPHLFPDCVRNIAARHHQHRTHRARTLQPRRGRRRT
jgi:hypothetical protein